MKNMQHPLWKRWSAFRNACTNSNNRSYKYYGGRGITYPARWDYFHRFVMEVEATIGPCPGPGYIFERIRNDEGYELDNICWSTPEENCNNRQSNHLVTAYGRTQTLAQWGKETGIPRGTLYSRLFDYGIDPETALNVNFKKINKLKET